MPPQPYNDQTELVLLKGNTSFIFLVMQFAVLSELETIGDGNKGLARRWWRGWRSDANSVDVFFPPSGPFPIAPPVAWGFQRGLASVPRQKHLSARERVAVVQSAGVPRGTVHQGKAESDARAVRARVSTDGLAHATVPGGRSRSSFSRLPSLRACRTRRSATSCRAC